jgi:hypothetical protein
LEKELALVLGVQLVVDKVVQLELELGRRLVDQLEKDLVNPLV